MSPGSRSEVKVGSSIKRVPKISSIVVLLRISTHRKPVLYGRISNPKTEGGAVGCMLKVSQAQNSTRVERERKMLWLRSGEDLKRSRAASLQRAGDGPTSILCMSGNSLC